MHYRDISTGIDFHALEQMAQSHPNEDVVILSDEMKIKDGLVYDIASGHLVGYTDIGINTSFNETTQNTPSRIATHVVVFMVQGLKSNFTVPVATYATSTATAEAIFFSFWELVSMIELYGLKERAFIGDGATSNRKFIKFHKGHYPNDPVTYRAKNKYATEE